MITCPQCQAQLADGTRFCGVCGHASLLTQQGGNAPPPDPMAAMVGQEIAGRFRITAKLGEGGMGAVFKAEQLSLKRTVALKLLQPGLAANEQLIRRFNAEAQVVAQLSHPNTVGIFDFGEFNGMLFIAMELIAGRSLRTVIHEEAPLSPQRTLAIASQIAASLSDAHAHNIVHRDLKPDNVMLQDRGKQRDVARVLDFGIAKLRADSRTAMNMTAAGDILGTPQYIAPEQIEGNAIDGRTDIYALGCMMYEMVTGWLPFESANLMGLLAKHMNDQPVPPSQRRPELNLPLSLDSLILWAMQKDPATRPATMDAFAEQMNAVAVTLPPDRTYAASAPLSTAHPVPTPQYPGPTPAPPLSMPPVSPTLPVMGHPPAKSRAPLFAIVGLLVIGGGIGVGVWAARRKERPEPVAPSEPMPASPKVEDLTAPPPAPPPTPPPPPPTVDDENALPAKAKLVVARGFDHRRGESSDTLSDAMRHIDVMLQIAPPGDMATLTDLYANTFGLVVEKRLKIRSAGAMRDAAMYTGTIEERSSRAILVLYEGPGYHLMVFETMPATAWNQKTVEDFLDKNVLMP